MRTLAKLDISSNLSGTNAEQRVQMFPCTQVQMLGLFRASTCSDEHSNFREQWAVMETETKL